MKPILASLSLIFLSFIAVLAFMWALDLRTELNNLDDRIRNIELSSRPLVVLSGDYPAVAVIDEDEVLIEGERE